MNDTYSIVFWLVALTSSGLGKTCFNPKTLPSSNFWSFEAAPSWFGCSLNSCFKETFVDSFSILLIKSDYIITEYQYTGNEFRLRDDIEKKKDERERKEEGKETEWEPIFNAREMARKAIRIRTECTAQGCVWKKCMSAAGDHVRRLRVLPWVLSLVKGAVLCKFEPIVLISSHPAV